MPSTAPADHTRCKRQSLLQADTTKARPTQPRPGNYNQAYLWLRKPSTCIQTHVLSQRSLIAAKAPCTHRGAGRGAHDPQASWFLTVVTAPRLTYTLTSLVGTLLGNLCNRLIESNAQRTALRLQRALPSPRSWALLCQHNGSWASPFCSPQKLGFMKTGVLKHVIS